MDNELEAFLQKVLQHDIGHGRSCAIGNFGDHIEKVGSEPSGPAGNDVLRDAVCRHDEVEHGRVAIYIPSVPYHATEILRKPARGRADMNVRYVKLRLLGKGGHYCQQTERSNRFHSQPPQLPHVPQAYDTHRIQIVPTYHLSGSSLRSSHCGAVTSGAPPLPPRAPGVPLPPGAAGPLPPAGAPLLPPPGAAP